MGVGSIPLQSLITLENWTKNISIPNRKPKSELSCCSCLFVQQCNSSYLWTEAFIQLNIFRCKKIRITNLKFFFTHPKSKIQEPIPFKATFKYSAIFMNVEEDWDTWNMDWPFLQLGPTKQLFSKFDLEVTK
jgi:hypothetical protein